MANELYLTSISYLRVARSTDGRHFTIDAQPALFPATPAEAFGIEDCRISEIHGVFYIAYKSVAPTGITVSLAATRDFLHYERKGIIFVPENLDVSISPEKVNGRYVALHRPVPRMLGAPNMWLSYSSDLLTWGDHHFLMGVAGQMGRRAHRRRRGAFQNGARLAGNLSCRDR